LPSSSKTGLCFVIIASSMKCFMKNTKISPIILTDLILPKHYSWNPNCRNDLKWRMSSSGMRRRMAFVRTEVSEKIIASIISVRRTNELGTTLAIISRRWHVTSKRRFLTTAIRRLISKDCILYSRRRKISNLA
jgi:hypothetical protein